MNIQEYFYKVLAENDYLTMKAREQELYENCSTDYSAFKNFCHIVGIDILSGYNKTIFETWFFAMKILYNKGV